MLDRYDYCEGFLPTSGDAGDGDERVRREQPAHFFADDKSRQHVSCSLAVEEQSETTMTVASCPSCHESVTIPVDATPESVVRCPFCHEDFELKSFLNQLPPSLIVLDHGLLDHGLLDHGSGIRMGESERSAEQADASSSNVLGAFVDVGEPHESSGSLPAFDFTPEPVDKEASRDTAGLPKARGQKNATVELVKIVAGALLAIPAAQLILWWGVPGSYKRDLLGIGPAVSRVVPWAVPRRFHARDDVSSVSSHSPRRIPAPQRRRGIVEQRQAVPRVENDSALTEPDAAQAAHSGRQAARDSHGKDDEGEEHSTAQAATLAGQEENDNSTAETRREATPAKARIRGVRGAPQYDLSQLRAALEKAVQASIAWDADAGQSNQRHPELTDQFYQAFARLSEAVTYPPPQEPGIQELILNVSDLLKTFVNQPKKLAMIGNETVEWLERSDRPSQGIFMFGTVTQINGPGPVYETKLELASLKKRTVTVVSRVDPRSTFATGDRILMLGAIVDRPDQNLLGYVGDEPMVVMGGFPVPLR